MSFTVEKLPDIPVVLLVQISSRVMDEIDDILPRLDAVLGRQAEPVFLILDVHNVLMTLDELTAVACSAADTRSSPRSRGAKITTSARTVAVVTIVRAESDDGLPNGPRPSGRRPQV